MARARARAIKCAAQLRDLGHAVQMYINDYRNAVPIALWISDPAPGALAGTGYSCEWTDLISIYAPNGSFAQNWNCPTSVADNQFFGYGINMALYAPAYAPGDSDDWSLMNMR